MEHPLTQLTLINKQLMLYIIFNTVDKNIYLFFKRNIFSILATMP